MTEHVPIIFIIIGIALAATVKSGCLAPVPILEPKPAATTLRFCFSGEYMINGKVSPAQGCFDTSPLCNHALKIARKYGNLGGIKSLSTCQER